MSNTIEQAMKHLTPYQIASRILQSRSVVSVACAGEGTAPDYDMLAVYQDSGPDAGLYITDENAIERLIREYSYDITGAGVREVSHLLKLYAPRKARSSDKDLIAVNNGIFDFRSKTLMPFSPDYVFLTKSRVNYNPNAQNVVIHNDNDGTDWDVESWLQEVFPDAEVRQLAWELLGAVIRPSVRWGKSALLCSTKGSSGKGSLCALMRNLCGPGAYANIPLADFSKEFGLEPLLKASAIIADGNDAGTYIDGSANLKALIYGDTIQVSRKFKLPVAFRFHGLMVQGLNGMPRLKDRSDSFWRRQLFIPFTQCFAGVEREYIREDYLKRPEVLEYVLWKVLNMNYYQLSEPEACKLAFDEQKAYCAPMTQFLDEIMPQLTWDLVPLDFIFTLYRIWMRRNYPSGRAFNMTTFSKKLSEEISLYPEWSYDRGKVHSTGHLMDRYEPLVSEYGLDWSYGASDKRKSSYRGLRRVAIQDIAVDDEERKDS